MEKANSAVDFITKLLALLLPISQFFVKYLPASVSSIFLSSKYFIASSIVVLLCCGTLWLLLASHPYFQIPLNPVQQKRYKRKLAEDQAAAAGKSELGETPAVNEVDRSFYFTPDNLQLISFVTALLLSIGFVLTGIISAGPRPSSFAIALQIVFYIVAMIGYFLVLSLYSQRRRGQESFTKLESTRAQNAINRAIESKAFASFPTVNYIGMEQQLGNPVSHVVYVSVSHADTSRQNYRIGTNLTGDIVYWVLPEEVFNQAARGS